MPEIPAGWSDLPLKVTPFDAANALDAAAKTQEEQQTAAANLPAVTAAQGRATAAETGVHTETAQAQLPGIRAESAFSVTTNNNKRLADAMAHATDTDSMHAAMQALVDDGVTQAAQYLKVPWSPRVQQQVATMYGAGTPTEALAAAQSGGLPLEAQPTSQEREQWDASFSQMSNDQLAAVLAKKDAIVQALTRVASSENPTQEWNREASQLGFDPSTIPPYTQLQAASMLMENAKLDNYLRGRVSNTQAGVPAPPAPTTVQEAGGGLYGVARGPQGPEVSTLVAPRPMLVGTDPNTGAAVYGPTNAGQPETVGTHPLGQKPGTYGAGSGGAYNIRYNAYLAVHPGDANGALEYARTGAQGAAGRQMGGAQIAQAADTQARADYNALVAGGTPPPEGEQAYMAQRTQVYTSQLQAAQNAANDAAGAPGGNPGGGAPPPAAPRRAGWTVPTPAPGSPAASARQAYTASVANMNDPRVGPQARANLERTVTEGARLPPMANPGPTPPPYIISLLKPDRVTPLKNGTGWVLRGGQPVRVW